MHPDDEHRPKSVPILAKLAHASAPFLSTFLLIHLSAPVLASVGGSSLSSSVMLLGREYYQTVLGERYLLWTPLAIHVASGIARRLVPSTSPTSRQRRPLTSTLSLAAYTSLVLLPIHVLTHRLAPTTPAPPIDAVGPAELDYEFVKTGLQRFPCASWALYAGLVAGVVVHAVEGANVLRATWMGAKPLSARVKRVVVAAVVIPVMAGLWTLSEEPLWALSSTVERYAACFTTVGVYRMSVGAVLNK